MTIYKKNANLVLGILGLIGGPLFFLMAYFIKKYEHDVFTFYRWCVYGVVLIFVSIYSLREYIVHKLVIGEDYVEIDDKKVPAFLIKEIQTKDKGWKVIIKTEKQDHVIGMTDFLPLTNRRKSEEIYGRLVELMHKHSSYGHHQL